jgi:hypothetical protein
MSFILVRPSCRQNYSKFSATAARRRGMTI